MRFVFLWLCAILFSGVVYGESDRDSLKVRLGAPRLNLGTPVLLTDSIPGAFIERLDELYSKWYVSRLEEGNYVDSVYLTEMVTGPAVPDSVYLQRLDKLNSAIKLSYNDIVRNYIELYTVRRRAQVGTMLGLSSYYFPIFEEVLDREGLPQELKYLPVIESALNPRAFSRAGACGLWQFMYGTGKMYKLEINSFIDERRDPVKYTEAAVCFLKDLYKIYEDWILVIAAYNCGPGNVNKAIRRSGSKKNYWDIYFHLPKETRGYVPAFIAAMYTFNYHKEHNIFPLENELPTMCDTIMISDALHFEQVAKLMDISVEQIRDLNPQYRSDIVPAGFGKSYALQVPYNHVGEFIDKQDTIFAYNRTTYFNDSDRTADPKNRFKKYAHAHAVPSNKAKLVYTVKSGDVIGKIAEKFNVRLSDLKYWNGMTKDRINIGQKLTVYVPNNKVDYYKSKVDAKYAGVAANAEVEAEPLTEGEFFYYTIKRGENLWSIAKKYPGVSNRDIMKWNGLTDRSAKNLKPGQKLKIKI